MEAKLRNLQGDLFAPSSERIHLATKDGIVVEADNQDSGITPQDDGFRKRGAQSGHAGRGRKIPDTFPIVEVIHEIPLNQKVCAHCGKSNRDLNMTEDSMEIDYEVKVIVKKHRRKKAAKTCDCPVPAIMTATKSPQIIPKGKFSTAFLCLIMVQKYFFQIPLNRQILQWAMEVLEVNAGTIIGSFKTILDFITPLYNLLVTVSRAQKQDRYSAYKVLEGQLQRQLCWYHYPRKMIIREESLNVAYMPEILLFFLDNHIRLF